VENGRRRGRNIASNPITTNEASHQAQIQNAKQTELEKLHHFNTFEVVKYQGQNTISTRWIITGEDSNTRARLVAKGFEEHAFIPSDSPTIGKGAVRMFLTVPASQNWNVKTTDIKSAFLQGDCLQRDVYIKPPKESAAPTGFIWKLKHGLYGLKDGARQFYMSVRDELLRLGCRQSEINPAMFIKENGEMLIGIVCCHVDDFLRAGNTEFKAMMGKLKQRFLAGKVR
jgi:hypothetical protein